MRTTTTGRWAVPAFGAVLGLAMLVAFGMNGEWGSGLAALGVMLAYGAVLLVGRRSEAVAVLGGDVRDERRRSIERDASVFAGYVLITVIIGAFLWEVSRGEDAQPWSALGAVGGLAYIGAVVVLRRLR